MNIDKRVKKSKLSVNKYNKKIIEIWKKQNVVERVPLLYPPLKKDAILFIGLNPSFSKKAFNTILKDTDYESVRKDLESYFSLKNYSTNKIQHLQKIAKLAREKYPYYKKFKDIAYELNMDWEHIDLLLMRMTNQKEVEKIKNEDENFFNAQIEINIKMMYDLKPQLIVVENAFASKILKERLEPKFDKYIGTYRTQNKTPMFFSGMLTGRRALDLGSLERLKWHLKFVNSQLY
jgi:hypothetical protein